MNEKLYTYRAKIVDVYDGDTVRAVIDLGFGHTFEGLDGKGVSLRLYEIDTPEIRGSEKEFGKEVRDYVRERILNKDVIIQTMKDRTGKYGRYLVNIYIDGVMLNEELVNKGYAKPLIY